MWAKRSFSHLSWETWANRSRWLICHELPEPFTHGGSFVLSDLSHLLTVTHLSWAIWANRSQSLICFEWNEQMSEFPALLSSTWRNLREYLQWYPCWASHHKLLCTWLSWNKNYIIPVHFSNPENWWRSQGKTYKLFNPVLFEVSPCYNVPKNIRISEYKNGKWRTDSTVYVWFMCQALSKYSAQWQAWVFILTLAQCCGSTIDPREG